jgi:hypothetical protein
MTTSSDIDPVQNSAQIDAPRRLESTGEIANRFHVRPWTIREWKRRGLISPTLRVGRLLRWDPAQVLADLDRAAREGRS